MDTSAVQSSLALEEVSKAIAEWTVVRHAELDESLPGRYGVSWRAGWVREVQNQIRLLAQAMAFQRPELFVASIAWSGSAFSAREMGPEDLGRSLACMREIIESKMPAPLAAAATKNVDVAIDGLDGAPKEPLPGVGLDRPFGEVALRYIEALLQGDRRRADGLILDAVDNGATVQDAYIEIIQPALAEIGRMWHLNEVTTADEHFATASAEMLMSRLRNLVEIPKPKGRSVVAATIAGETHTLGVRMVADFFEMDGWDVLYLGANMPTLDLIQKVRERRADLLAVSVTNVLHMRTLGELIDVVRAAADLDRVRILVGGAPFKLAPDIWRQLGVDGASESAPAAVELGNRLVEDRADC